MKYIPTYQAVTVFLTLIYLSACTAPPIGLSPAPEGMTREFSASGHYYLDLGEKYLALFTRSTNFPRLPERYHFPEELFVENAVVSQKIMFWNDGLELERVSGDPVPGSIVGTWSFSRFRASYQLTFNKDRTFLLKGFVSGWIPPTTGRPLLVHEPTELDKVADGGVTPLGVLAPGAGRVLPATNHLIEYNTAAQNNPDGPCVTVFAPADGAVTRIVRREGFDAAVGPYSDYSIEFVVTESYKILFEHVGALSERLAAAVKSESADVEVGADVEVVLKSGEPIGFAAGLKDALPALGFGGVDLDAPLPHVNPLHYKHADPRRHYASSPIAFFKSGLRSDLVGLIDGDGSPAWGTVCHDRYDTLAGNWFAEELTGNARHRPENTLAFVRDPLDPTQIRISMGDHTQWLCACDAGEGIVDSTCHGGPFAITGVSPFIGKPLSFETITFAPLDAPVVFSICEFVYDENRDAIPFPGSRSGIMLVALGGNMIKVQTFSADEIERTFGGAAPCFTAGARFYTR